MSVVFLQSVGSGLIVRMETGVLTTTQPFPASCSQTVSSARNVSSSIPSASLTPGKLVGVVEEDVNRNLIFFKLLLQDTVLVQM